MNRHVWYLLLIAVLGGSLVYVYRRDGAGRQLLADAARELNQQTVIISHLDHANDSLRRENRTIDSLYRVQRTALAMTDTVYRRAPILVIHDTAWVPKAVADADIKACFVTLSTCELRATLAEARVANRDSAATVAEDNARKARALADGVVVAARKQKWQWGLSGFGAGAMSCSLLSIFHGR